MIARDIGTVIKFIEERRKVKNARHTVVMCEESGGITFLQEDNTEINFQKNGFIADHLDEIEKLDERDLVIMMEADGPPYKFYEFNMAKKPMYKRQLANLPSW